MTAAHGPAMVHAHAQGEPALRTGNSARNYGVSSLITNYHDHQAFVLTAAKAAPRARHGHL